jgi:hypothetical protein
MMGDDVKPRHRHIRDVERRTRGAGTEDASVFIAELLLPFAPTRNPELYPLPVFYS